MAHGRPCKAHVRPCEVTQPRGGHGSQDIGPALTQNELQGSQSLQRASRELEELPGSCRSFQRAAGAPRELQELPGSCSLTVLQRSTNTQQ